jgi:SAM-dependent methyltransferase
MKSSEKAPLGTFLAANPFPRPLTDGLFYREKMRAIHRIAPDTLGVSARSAAVLEIGGGRSGLTSLLYPSAHVVTVDLDHLQLLQHPRLRNSSVVCGDACALPFGDGSFDAVTMFDVLEHIPDDAKAASEALRVTRPQGWLLLSTPNADWHYPYHRFMRRWCPPEARLMTEWGHVRRGYSGATLVKLFGGNAERRSSFINPITAFFHDVSFSRLRRRWRTLLYAAAAPATMVGYAAHASAMRGTETAFAWRRR